MGCSTSRIDQLPAVSLCHDRCKFIEEALHQSYALGDAHFAYMHSLKSLGPTLRNFFHQNLVNQSGHQSQAKGQNIKDVPDQAPGTKSSSPDNSSFGSDESETHIDFPSDSEDEFGKKDFGSSQGVHASYFSHSGSYNHREQAKYDDYADNGESAWITPSPPAPSNSAWDFLNFFEPYERYELSTRNNEDLQDGKSKEKSVSKDHKPARYGDVKQNQDHIRETNNVVSEKEKNKDQKGSVKPTDHNVSEIMAEVESMFDRVAESGNEFLQIFDTGKFRYHNRNPVNDGVSSKMIHVALPSFLVSPFKSMESLPSSEKMGSVHVGLHQDLELMPVNLSSTLKKLCLWERKLYDEVKAEEKLRVIYAKYWKQMRGMGEKGADANKIESAEAALRALSTRIRVAIKVIEKISVTINKLRDEELWPQIGDLVHKLLQMWKVMVECHRCQSQAVGEATSLDAIASKEKFSDVHLEATIQLRIELHNWNLRFSNWITAQRNYVKALNGWLMRCLPSGTEEIPGDSLPPAGTPDWSGKPPVFVLCNQWSDSMNRSFSEMEVIEAMNRFFTSVNQLLESHFLHLQQRQNPPDKDIDRKMKILEREGQRMHRLIQARERKLYQAAVDVTGGAALPGKAVHQSDVINNISFQVGLKQIFIAMEKLCSNSVQKYEELHMRIEEKEKPARAST